MFSESEIDSLINFYPLNKMFDVMDIKTSFEMFKDPYANIISNIIYQQVAFKVARYSELMLFDYLDYEVTPERVLQLTNEEFKRFKITGRRIEYIRNFSNYVIENKLHFYKLLNSDTKTIESELIKITGIGKWTIEMFFLFGLGRSDVLSFGDLIIINGLKHLYGDDDFRIIKTEINDFATITSINLWKYIEQGYYKLQSNN